TRMTGELLVQRFAEHHWDAPHAVNAVGPPNNSMLRVDLHGNFTAGWRDPFGLAIRYLDSVGFPSSSTPVPIQYEGFLNGSLRIGPLANGAAIVWSESSATFGGRLRAEIGTRRFTIPNASGALEWELDVLPEGGCLIAWHEFNGIV